MYIVYEKIFIKYDYNNTLLRISYTMWSVLSPGKAGNPKMTVTNVHRSTRLRARTAMVSGFDVS